VQGDNLQVADADASPVVQISNFALLLKNRFRQRGMHGLGGSALLTGTGMAFPWALFADAPLASDALAEDLHLGVALTARGHRVRYVGDVHVTSDAASQRDTLVQRTRWEHGFVSTAMREALPLLGKGVATLSPARILLALHLLVPPMALLFALGLGVLLFAWILGWFGAGWIPAMTLAVIMAAAVAATLLCWFVGGRSVLRAGTLLRIPLYILWKLPIYLKLAKKPETQWIRTGRGKDGK
jgi:cellulose synthase/poly-beta-1,6-N-acetylglucosamine synthase-like glycosyltransferase